MKHYECKTCGNLFEVIRDSAIVPICCSESMEILKPQTIEQELNEKHVPIVTVNGNKLEITVGSVLHPMEEKHHIEWIELETNKAVYRRNLLFTDTPCVTFYLSEDKEQVINIYAYCNIHGLWSVK